MKYAIVIPEPCHEDWANMTPADRGRFCGTCQKTVVDFSSMSDRQILEQFRKKSDGVCGRFNPDQLNRALLSPSQFSRTYRSFVTALPALMFFLESCAQHPQVKNEVRFQRAQTTPSLPNRTLLGDTVMVGASVVVPALPVQHPVTIPAGPPTKSVSEISDTGRKQECASTDLKPPNLLVDITNDPDRKFETLLGSVGGARMVRFEEIPRLDTIAPLQTIEPVKVPEVKVFPNPAKAGTLITVEVPGNGLPRQIQLVDGNGNLVMNILQKSWDEAQVFNLRLPASLAHGVYFLRLLFANTKQSQTAKILVE